MRGSRSRRVALLIVLAATVAACSSDDDDTDGLGSPEMTATPTMSPTPTINVVSLDQGWSDETRMDFWFTTQGSQILPYEFFLALEQVSSTELFRSAANMASYGYLPAPPSDLNPDGLPIGFVRHVDDTTGDAYLGFSCAACHTSQINYQGTGMLIDGAGTLADFNTFSGDLVAALDATADDDATFDRFATAILGPNYTPAQANELRDALVQSTLQLAERNQLNMPPSAAGFARLDAFGNIFNELMVVALDEPANASPPSAPVSYPFLWTTAQLDLVQWNGSAPNAGVIGPLARNIGEVIGVFGNLEIEPDSLTGYPSTIDVLNLGSLEVWVADLLSPQWPNEYLPPIDAVKAASGEVLYNTYCASCHQIIDRTNTSLEIEVVMVPVSDVGTDPTMAVNAATRTGQTGPLEGTYQYIIPFVGDTFGPTASATSLLINGVIGVLINNPIEGLEAAIEEYRENQMAKMFDPESYKARPLNGIWATAPYLHNGSVPNLAQLLLPPGERITQFAVGSREFDPVNVGLVTEMSAGAYHYDTTVPGNSNSGHTYGTTELSASQQLELIEFLKTL